MIHTLNLHIRSSRQHICLDEIGPPVPITKIYSRSIRFDLLYKPLQLYKICPFIGEPADFSASSLPTRRDILKFVQFLRLNTVTKLSNDGLFDIVSKRFVICIESRSFTPTLRSVKR